MTADQPRLSVLVADGSADAADSTAELLALHGHAVRVAYRGDDALTLARRDPPDVALLEIRMPGTDGCELARLLAAGPGPRRPFLVAVTGCGSAVDRARSAEAGFDLHLVKPVEPAILVGLLRRFERVLATPASPAAPGPSPAPEEPGQVAS